MVDIYLPFMEDGWEEKGAGNVLHPKYLQKFCAEFARIFKLMRPMTRDQYLYLINVVTQTDFPDAMAGYRLCKTESYPYISVYFLCGGTRIHRTGIILNTASEEGWVIAEDKNTLTAFLAWAARTLHARTSVTVCESTRFGYVLAHRKVTIDKGVRFVYTIKDSKIAVDVEGSDFERSGPLSDYILEWGEWCLSTAAAGVSVRCSESDFDLMRNFVEKYHDRILQYPGLGILKQATCENWKLCIVDKPYSAIYGYVSDEQFAFVKCFDGCHGMCIAGSAIGNLVEMVNTCDKEVMEYSSILQDGLSISDQTANMILVRLEDTTRKQLCEVVKAVQEAKDKGDVNG